MPKVQEQGNNISSSLHSALTNSQCNKCGAQLEWNSEFDNINSPKYTARHCGQDYLITIDSVKVEMVEPSIAERGRKENNNSMLEENEKPKAILIAEKLENNDNKPHYKRKQS